MPEALVKLQRKGQMVIPRSLREEVGIAEGTLMKVAVVKGGRFLLTPQITVDRSAVSPSLLRGHRGDSVRRRPLLP